MIVASRLALVALMASSVYGFAPSLSHSTKWAVSRAYGRCTTEALQLRMKTTSDKMDRRNVLGALATFVAGSLLGQGASPMAATAAKLDPRPPSPDDLLVYFGAGCFWHVQEFAAEKGMKLVPGKGNDPDSLKDKTIFVYDTAEFPFYPGELYHQYHDDMVEKYGPAYAAMRDDALAAGALAVSACPGDRSFLGRL